MATNSLATAWILCGLAITIMVIRLVFGRLFKQKFDTGDQLTVAAIVFSIARIAFTHVIIIWGTNNISDAYRNTHQFSKLEIYHREMGSKFTLVARSLYILL
jgi:ABC-type polysaccharide/polyol phosphate export permease